MKYNKDFLMKLQEWGIELKSHLNVIEEKDMKIIQEKLKHLPTNPGVYVMLDSDGKIIYVGKAKNLKNRVRQYFFNGVKGI